MTEKVHFERRDDVVIPMNMLASAEDVGTWYADGLRWSLEHGERALAIACFDTERTYSVNLNRAAQAVLREATDLLYAHPEVESLTIFCGDERTWEAYNFWWNMLYAEFKPEHEH